jgi:DNA-binding response OmpR family regulator
MDGPVRLLVVDDDAPTRRLLSAALTSEGVYEVVTAHGGEEALAVYQNSPDFDLIISDLTMPGMPGIEFIVKIRSLGCRVPILVLSSMQTDQSVARALESGADDYLQKPVDLRELRRAVAFLVDQYAERKQTDAEESAPAAVTNVNGGTFVELTALSDTIQTGRFQRFVDRLLATSLNESERNDLHLALEEIVQNAIEWGNRSDRTKKLRLSYCLLPDRITFRVEDEGAGFDHSEISDPSRNPGEHIEQRRASGKRMGGWGIFLTRKVMDEVTYNRKGNVVFLTKYLRRGGLTTVLNNTAPVAAPLNVSDTAAAVVPAVPTAPTKPTRRNTRLMRKTTRLLRKEDPRYGS